MEDQVLCFRAGEWSVIVDGVIHGCWNSRDAAEIALVVEQRRAAAKKAKQAAA